MSDSIEQGNTNLDINSLSNEKLTFVFFFLFPILRVYYLIRELATEILIKNTNTLTEINTSESDSSSSTDHSNKQNEPSQPENETSDDHLKDTDEEHSQDNSSDNNNITIHENQENDPANTDENAGDSLFDESDTNTEKKSDEDALLDDEEEEEEEDYEEEEEKEIQEDRRRRLELDYQTFGSTIVHTVQESTEIEDDVAVLKMPTPLQMEQMKHTLRSEEDSLSGSQTSRDSSVLSGARSNVHILPSVKSPDKSLTHSIFSVNEDEEVKRLFSDQTKSLLGISSSSSNSKSSSSSRISSGIGSSLRTSDFTLSLVSHTDRGNSLLTAPRSSISSFASTVTQSAGLSFNSPHPSPSSSPLLRSSAISTSTIASPFSSSFSLSVSPSMSPNNSLQGLPSNSLLASRLRNSDGREEEQIRQLTERSTASLISKVNKSMVGIRKAPSENQNSSKIKHSSSIGLPQELHSRSDIKTIKSANSLAQSVEMMLSNNSSTSKDSFQSPVSSSFSHSISSPLPKPISSPSGSLSSSPGVTSFDHSVGIPSFASYLTNSFRSPNGKEGSDSKDSLSSPKSTSAKTNSKPKSKKATKQLTLEFMKK